MIGRQAGSARRQDVQRNAIAFGNRRQVKPGQPVSVQLPVELVAARHEAAVAVSLQQAQTAEIADRLESAVHIALADALRTENDAAARSTIAGGDDLARAALDYRNVEVTWLSAKVD